MGETLHDFANGLDFSSVSNINDNEVIKSFGNSTTCPSDLSNNQQVKTVIYLLAESVAERMKKKNYYAKCVSVWIKNNKLETIDRQTILDNPTNVSEDIAMACYKLFCQHFDWSLTVRAIGVRVTNLTDGKIQYDIFENVNNLERKQRLETVIETIRRRFGYEIIRRGNVLAHDGLSGINPHSEIHVIHPKGFFKAKL